MSTTERKLLAIAAGTGMVLASIVGVSAPASAAANNVELEPSDGENYSVFMDDTYSMDITLPTFVPTATAYDNFALAITNPDSENLDVTFEGAADDSDWAFKILYVDEFNDPIGAPVAVTAHAEDSSFAVQFTNANSTTTEATTAIFYQFKEDRNTDVDNVPGVVRVNKTSGGIDQDEFSIGLTAWVDSEGQAATDIDTVEASTASATRTVTFIDPIDVSAIVKLERTIDDSDSIAGGLNLKDDTGIVGTIKFSRSTINLDQVDWTDWKIESFKGDDTAGDAKTADDTASFNTGIISGFDNADEAGKRRFNFPVDGTTLADDSSYQVKVNYDDTSDGETRRVFSSNAFQVVSSATNSDGTNTLGGSTLEVTETDDAVETTSSSTPVSLRTGAATADYTFQAGTSASPPVDVELANIPAIITVTATEGSVSVSGSGDGTREGAVVYNTLTDSDGTVEFTVTSSAAENDAYTVDASFVKADGSTVDATQIVATYVDGALSTMEADSDVYTGETVTMSIDIEDQFGKAQSVDDGDTIRVTAVATDDDNLEQTVDVVNGEAVITFANYLAEGESDVITIDAHTGPYDDQDDALSALGTIDVTLYANQTVQAVTVTADEVTTKVGYTPFSDDPILDGDDPTLVTANKGTINGTVIDSSGAGIPGASVTMTAASDEVQFYNVSGDDYDQGSITFAANEAGVFQVDVWSHVADDVDVTITSGGKSATVTLEGELMADDSIDAGNLVLSWNLPEAVVVNTTYAVTTTLTDVWGNGINDATVLFTGQAAAQFNSDDTASKTTGSDGTATAYLRSLEDVTGLAAVSVEVTDIDADDSASTDVTSLTDSSISDDEDTPWDESSWNDEISTEVTFLSTAPAATAGQKVNAGSFKGYVAVYARGYEGQRLSAKIGNDWVIVDPIVNNEGGNLHRTTDFTGAGVDIAVRIYIDRVLVDTINLTTK